MQIGGKLRSGEKHDGRAPDYDDWALNGDILMWNPMLERAFEISSMGIRVDEESMARQLTLAGCEDRRRSCPSTRCCSNGELPLDHRRRHRPEPPLHAADRQLPTSARFSASIWDAETMKQL